MELYFLMKIKYFVSLLFCYNIVFAFPNQDELVQMNNYKIATYDTIWQRMLAGFKLHHKETNLVKYYEYQYTKNPRLFERILWHAALYLYFILDAVESYGLPTEVALIPIIESDYNPFSTNDALHYDGIWQITPKTGRIYHLYERYHVNYRKSVYYSTNAILQYLYKLNLIFKNWEITVAAYNMGLGNTLRLLHHHHNVFGFLHHHKIPEVTTVYIAKLYALANIITYSKKFHIRLPKVPNIQTLVLIDPPIHTTVESVYRHSHTKFNVFMWLNAQFNSLKYVISPHNKILLPVNNAKIYMQYLYNKKIDIGDIVH